MILVAGLSPAWQQVLRFESFQVGRVNRASQTHWCASGKVLNAAVALHQLRGPGSRATIAPVGGAAGESIKQEFQRLDIPGHWIQTESPTRICTTIVPGQGQTTELVEKQSALTAVDLERFQAAYAELARVADVTILTGSVPHGTPDSLYRHLVTCTPSRVVLDARGPELLEALAQHPFLVKPNRDELAHTLGKSLKGEQAVFAAMDRLRDQGAEWVVVTDGDRPVRVLSESGRWSLTPPSVEVVNPIGAGDAMTAGIARSLHDGDEPLDAIRMGMAAATASLGQLLPSRLDGTLVTSLVESIVIDGA